MPGPAGQDRFPGEDVRVRRSLARQTYVPYLGATGDLEMGNHRVSCLELGIHSQTTLPVTAVLGDIVRLSTDGHLYLGV